MTKSSFKQVLLVQTGTETGTVVNFYIISDDFDHFYHLLLMLKHYTIDMPTRINQFVVLKNLKFL